jgi:hypothetical protein
MRHQWGVNFSRMRWAKRLERKRWAKRLESKCWTKRLEGTGRNGSAYCVLAGKPAQNMLNGKEQC